MPHHITGILTQFRKGYYGLTQNVFKTRHSGHKPSYLQICHYTLTKSLGTLGRVMTVKWHNEMSSVKGLPGGAPQGASLGIWSFLKQTNDLELINLVSIGMASHNPRLNVPSNIPASNLFITSDNLKTQNFMKDLETWTQNRQMKLNAQKTQNIIFNFTKNYQFS